MSESYASQTARFMDEFMESRTDDRETFTEYVDRQRREELP